METAEQPSDLFKLFVFDDGAGRQVYAAGGFTTAGGTPAVGIARWNGRSWSAMGDGLGPSNGGVWGMASFDDGSGVTLYAGGYFTSAGGASASFIAKWDGRQWSSVGGGTNGLIRTLAVVDDGSGPALYAGGGFTEAGGSPASRIARWDGTRWHALSGGMNSGVNALAFHGLGNSASLYAGGFFTLVDGRPANRIARWQSCPLPPRGPTTRP